VFYSFWIILHSKPEWFNPQGLLHLEPVHFPILEIAISVFWSLLVFASACSLALDTGDYIRLAIANLFTVVLLSCFLCNGFISYKHHIGHDPWNYPPEGENPEKPNEDEKDEKETGLS